jgi:hypothetical protein
LPAPLAGPYLGFAADELYVEIAISESCSLPHGSPINIPLMIRITITATAFEAIAATLPSSVGVEQNRAPHADYFIWLDPRYVERLRAMRGPGESYSDVILRLAEASS